LREERHERRILEQTPSPGDAAVDIDQVGDLYKREEGDAQGKDDVPLHLWQQACPGEVVEQEVRVLEVPEEGEVHSDSQGQEKSRAAPRSVEQCAPEIIEGNGQQDQQDKLRIPVAVKDKRRCDQRDHGRGGQPQPRDEPKDHPCDRQKNQQEYVRVKQHSQTSVVFHAGAVRRSKALLSAPDGTLANLIQVFPLPVKDWLSMVMSEHVRHG